jgi:tetratricopeptide (TPR) repeat protein
LLSRATASMSEDDPEIVPALIDLGIALTETGELEGSSATLDRAVAIGEARIGGPVAARARVVRWHQSFWTRWGVLNADDVERRIPSELALFERTGDVLGQAWAWTTLGALSWGRCRAAETLIAWRRGVDLFRQAGERHMADDYLTWLVSVFTWGPDSCAHALEEIDRLRAEAEGSLAVEAEIASDSATLLWMTGRFDEGRQVARAGHLVRAELGRRVADAHSAQLIGWLELMAGNPEEADAILRAAGRELRELGSSSFQVLSAMHAHALYALGRYDEAEHVATDGLDEPIRDVATNVLCLEARAMVAARRGAFDRAEDLARRGLALIDEGDFLNDQADARICLAEVLELAGRTPEAADATRDALDRYRRKGNVTQTAMAETGLIRLDAAANRS